MPAPSLVVHKTCAPSLSQVVAKLACAAGLQTWSGLLEIVRAE